MSTKTFLLDNLEAGLEHAAYLSWRASAAGFQSPEEEWSRMSPQVRNHYRWQVRVVLSAWIPLKQVEEMQSHA